METKQELQQELARLEKLTQKVKAKIENALEVGKWYKFGFKGLFCFQGYEKEHYGFDNIGIWSSSLGHVENNGQASREEVEKALVNEAKKRGFKKGVKISSEWVSFNKIVDLENEKYILFDNETLTLSGWGIFNKVVWAEIIPEHEYKDGDIVIASIGYSEYIITFKDKFGSQFNGYNYSPLGSECIMKSEGAFDSIERYATDEEKELFLSLLNPKPKVGDVCKFWDYFEHDFVIGVCKEIGESYYYVTNDEGFKNSKTLTQQEVIDLLF